MQIRSTYDISTYKHNEVQSTSRRQLNNFGSDLEKTDPRAHQKGSHYFWLIYLYLDVFGASLTRPIVSESPEHSYDSTVASISPPRAPSTNPPSGFPRSRRNHVLQLGCPKFGRQSGLSAVPQCATRVLLPSTGPVPRETNLDRELHTLHQRIRQRTVRHDRGWSERYIHPPPASHRPDRAGAPHVRSRVEHPQAAHGSRYTAGDLDQHSTGLVG
jgi:hypothetical protein